MEYKYGIVKEKYLLNKERRMAYGIAAFAQPEELGTSCIVKSYHDITTNKKKILELADACNEGDLDPNQLGDVIENFLFDLSLN